MEQPKEKPSLKMRLRSIFYGSTFQTSVDVSIGEEEEPRKKEKVVINKKKICITIYFNDNSTHSFFKECDEDTKETYFSCYREFYKWFFSRDSSELYNFKYDKGGKIFRKSDIKRVDFEYKIEPGV